MSQISESCHLSQRYTNHCVRVSSMQTLDRENFEGGDIMRISGHKCLKSVNTYARTLTTSKKRKMSQALTSSLTDSQITESSSKSTQEVVKHSLVSRRRAGNIGKYEYYT